MWLLFWIRFSMDDSISTKRLWVMASFSLRPCSAYVIAWLKYSGRRVFMTYSGWVSELLGQGRVLLYGF